MDKTSLATFTSSEFGTLRAVKDDAGEPWFVAKDVCDALEISNRNRAMQQLDPDEKGGTYAYTPGGEQQFTTVSEAGFYRLVLTFTPSNAREAVA